MTLLSREKLKLEAKENLSCGDDTIVPLSSMCSPKNLHHRQSMFKLIQNLNNYENKI